MATWFQYDYCRDLPAMRTFYVDVLGLTQVWDGPETFAVVHDDVQLSFTQTDATRSGPTQPGLTRPGWESQQVDEGWAFQPGWAHGQLRDAPAGLPVRSVSFALRPQHFQAVVARLQATGYPRLRPEPFWVGYWSFVVRDPEGTTVELSDPVSPAPADGV